ncbi:MAG: hypothetical protein FWF79_05280 [Defluviitaleaceae bacterium]|nr:hypothetical protein [Defluviitaleaceae bacterium]
MFRNATLEFYGIKTSPIKEIINPELPAVEVAGGAADVVFLLEDNSYLHFAFVTGRRHKNAMQKCAGYDLRLYERDGRLIQTVLIYTAEVKRKPKGLKIGSLEYNPNIILMGNYDGNTIFSELEAKLISGQELTDVDLLNLVLLPLMKHTMPRRELAENTIRLAQKIPNETKRDACIAAAYAFTSKHLNEADRLKLLEVLRMCDVLERYVDGRIDEKVNEKANEIAKNQLRDKFPLDMVIRHTGLDMKTVKRLKAEVDRE